MRLSQLRGAHHGGYDLASTYLSYDEKEAVFDSAFSLHAGPRRWVALLAIGAVLAALLTGAQALLVPPRAEAVVDCGTLNTTYTRIEPLGLSCRFLICEGRWFLCQRDIRKTSGIVRCAWF